MLFTIRAARIRTPVPSSPELMMSEVAEEFPYLFSQQGTASKLKGHSSTIPGYAEEYLAFRGEYFASRMTRP